MSATASSSRSSRSPKPAPKSIPNASCSRSNQPPPRPRIARPPRQVVEGRRELRGQPRVAERVGGDEQAEPDAPGHRRERRERRPALELAGRAGRPRRPAGDRRPRASPSRPPRRRGTASRSSGQPSAGSRTPRRSASHHLTLGVAYRRSVSRDRPTSRPRSATRSSPGTTRAAGPLPFRGEHGPVRDPRLRGDGPADAGRAGG